MLSVFASHLKIHEAYVLQGMLSAHGLRAYVWHDYSANFYPELTFGGACVALDGADLADAEMLYRSALVEVGDEWNVSEDEAVCAGFDGGKYPDFLSLASFCVKWFLVCGFLIHFAAPMFPHFDELGQGTVDFAAMGEQLRISTAMLVAAALTGLVAAALGVTFFRMMRLMNSSNFCRHFGAAVLVLMYYLPGLVFVGLIFWIENIRAW